MSFDKIFDLTAGVFLFLYYYLSRMTKCSIRLVTYQSSVNLATRTIITSNYIATIIKYYINIVILHISYVIGRAFSVIFTIQNLV